MENKWIKRGESLNNPQYALRIMKTLIIFLFAAMFSAAANTYSQEMKIELNLKNTRVKDVFTEIEKQSSYIFLLSGNIENELNRKVDVDVHSESVDEILKIVIARTNLKYEVVDKQIVVYPNADTSKNNFSSVEAKQKEQSAQQRISGIVTDKKDGVPIIGANVSVPNTATGTVTNEKGQYSLSVPVGSTLRFSYIGYVTQEFKITNQAILNVQLVENISEIDEVVVTGYANVRKESFTGSVTQIKKDELQKVSPGNIINTIQAFDPSFRIMENISIGSNPNALPEFYMRGQSGLPGVKELDILESSDVSQFSLQTNPNTPIFILDGFEVGVQKIYDLDLTRIKSVTLLKDASSTAIYGSRAANGVIVIETVTPQSGKIRVNYSGNYSLTEPDLSSYNLMNAKEKIQAEMDANFFGEPDPSEYQHGSYEQAKWNKRSYYISKNNQLLRGVDTYWLSRPLTSSFNHKHNLFIEGGVDMFRYGIDMRYDKENGVMKGSFRNRKGVGLVTEYMGKKLQIRNQTNFDIMTNQNSPYGDFETYVRLQPYYEPINAETGEYFKDYSTLWGSVRSMKNPLYEASLDSYSNGGYKEWTNNLSVNWRIMPHLLVKGQYAISYNDSENKNFIDPRSTKYTRSDDFLQRGELRISNSKSLRQNLNLFGAYSQSIKQHYLNLSSGVNVMTTDFNSASYWYRGIPNKEYSDPAFANKIEEKPYFNDNKIRLFGAFFTSNYSYKNIYLLDASLRVDGSSEFGSNRKWAPFWSVGTGINFHNYPFLKQNKNVTMLRITGNMGQTGKSNFSPYMANNMYKIMNDDWYPTGIGANLIYLGNSDLTWEKTVSSNIALDIAFQNRYFLRVDFYNKTTKDLINDVSLPTSSGFRVYRDNIGEIRNRGFEIKTNLNVVKTKDWNLILFANLSQNKNKIMKLSESLKRYNERVDQYFDKYVNTADVFFVTTNKQFTRPIKKFEEGNSLTTIYGMKSLGINPANGKEVFEKRDGTITYDWNSVEQQVIGNTEPLAQGAFGLNAQYKQWMLYTTFLYEFGGDRYNQTLVNEVENVDLMHSNADKRVSTERWTKPGDITPLKNIKDGLVVTRVTSRFVQKNNYVRFNSLSLGYNFEPGSLKKYGLTMLRLQFNMNDIALFSTIRREMGTTYPFARTFSFTLNTAF
ncbi:MAG: SusC/RagA family TonB-linked outer membrane protein [Bacteroidia bacterium]|nr:SusC/RagA family TonB-linked outer membrane protein [Bacteroidia bacterium]